jgi:hypothetical protein
MDKPQLDFEDTNPTSTYVNRSNRNHTGSRPISITWQLLESVPTRLLRTMARQVAVWSSINISIIDFLQQAVGDLSPINFAYGGVK